MIEILTVIALMCQISGSPVHDAAREQAECQWVLVRCVGVEKKHSEERLAGCIETYTGQRKKWRQ